jgi:sulfatase maturation enzyme AslB (radical SAM superfamily)
MRIGQLALVVSEDCNFRCRYCYQTRRPNRMSGAVARRALVFFCRG